METRGLVRQGWVGGRKAEMIHKGMAVTIIILLCLSSCGDQDSSSYGGSTSTSTDPIVGHWSWCGMSDSMGGTVVGGNTGGVGSFSFSQNGTFSNSQVFSPSTGTWTKSGSSYTLSTSRSSYQARLSGGVLYVNIQGMVFCFD